MDDLSTMAMPADVTDFGRGDAGQGKQAKQSAFSSLALPSLASARQGQALLLMISVAHSTCGVLCSGFAQPQPAIAPIAPRPRHFFSGYAFG